MLRSFALSLVAVGLLAAGCSADAAEGSIHDDEEPIGQVSSALKDGDPVSLAVTESCSTTAVKGLAIQLVEEIQCLRPGTMKKIDGVPGLQLGAAVFPYLQTPAADALIAAQKVRNVTLSMNSGLRTLPQQYLLYRWYQTKRCGIGLAASPGKSNHESAIAIDINDNAAWRSALQGKGYRWLGANDPVHFDFGGKGAVDLRGLSVEAFQRLWNRNHPEDKIGEDGDYGVETEKRLARAPANGFAIGAKCDGPAAQNIPPPMAEAPSVPDGEEPATSTDATEPQDDADDGDDGATPGSSRKRALGNAESGCNMHGTSGRADLPFFAALGLGLLVWRRRRSG
ncbi:MAG: M15 family metallopeptidase [Labilithrix sp.]|nr:M15 family metallopeptidase [Labilithrix sp.]MCW5818168.1 M15 family metallopeptidase [Labilithrix sp.]